MIDRNVFGFYLKDARPIVGVAARFKFFANALPEFQRVFRYFGAVHGGLEPRPIGKPTVPVGAAYIEQTISMQLRQYQSFKFLSLLHGMGSKFNKARLFKKLFNLF